MSRKPPPLTAADYRRLDARCTAREEVFAVKSRSKPGAEHAVSVNHRTGAWSCTCPATVARCAHIALVQDEQARAPWQRHWRQCPDRSLVLTDRELTRRAADLSPDERIQYDTLGDEIARRCLSLEAVAALLRAPGLDEARAKGRKAMSELFGAS